MHDWVARQLGSAVVDRRPVAGGCIHQAWRLRLANGRILFAKSNRAAALPQLAAEAEGLRALAAWARPPLRVPEPVALGQAGEVAVLLLPWLELGAGAADPGAAGWRSLGAALAALHRASAAAAPDQGYGFPADNFIGASSQRNGWLRDWSRFFVERRLGPQLALATRRGQPLAGGAALLERVRLELRDHHCPAALVHGDLWSGNAALLAGCEVAVFDPAAYWGDREVDLAMARLFGGFPEHFFEAYQEAWPLPAGHRSRVDLYNLYHLLNHANLFGGGYQRQAQALIDRLLG